VKDSKLTKYTIYLTGQETVSHSLIDNNIFRTDKKMYGCRCQSDMATGLQYVRKLCCQVLMKTMKKTATVLRWP